MDIDVAEREHLAVDELKARLAGAFARSHSAERVRSAVVVAHHRFDGRPIRDFVPIFVERIAKEDLRRSAS
ncbi:three-helix bundle dimerization domain-containing protein [Nonomuraea sp. NPDC049158]|uniref:three-helix bundle dimerization domain-containing protein n=1 Tax=Nonomuraea sp. NPDC049158 TaxID=3155649 RepID=UPI003411B808